MEKKYKIKVPKAVHQAFKIYHAVGLWKIGNGKVSLQQAVYFIFILAFVLSSFIGIWTTDSADNTIFLTVVSFCGMVQTYRLYFIICKQNRILDFMHIIEVNNTDDYQTFCHANKKINKFVTYAKAYFGMLLVLCVVVICSPLVKKQLLLDIAFPLDYKINEIAFWMAHAFVVGVYVLSVTIFIFVILIWYMMLIFVVKYDLVASEFRNLGVERKEEITKGKPTKEVTTTKTQMTSKELSPETLADTKVEENSYVNNFVESIKGLNSVNEQLDDFESMFSTIFLLQILTSSICICGVVFILAFSNHDSIYQDAFFFVEIIYCLADIYVVLYLANEIMLSSGRLGYSIFQSNWMDQTQSCKKYILIVVEYLKQPRLLVVGKLFPMNLQTFIVIVNRAYTMFNILRNFQQ